MYSNVLLSLLAALPIVSPHPTIHVLHEKRGFNLSGAIDRRRIDGDVLLPMRIGLKSNTDAMENGEEWLMAISDPTSPDYGKFWTRDQVIDAFAPHEDSVNSVIDWLNANGISALTHTDNKQWIAFDLPASQAEALLRTEFYEHERANGGSEASRDEYHLPEHLSSHVDFITPGIKSRDITGRSKRSLDALKKRALHKPEESLCGETYDLTKHQKKLMKIISKNPETLEYCNEMVTPACIRALYNITLPTNDARIDRDNFLGLFEWKDLYYQGDLDRLYRSLTRNVPPGTLPIFYSVDGGEAPPTSPQSSSWCLVRAENDLDIQVSQPIIYPQKVAVYQVDDHYYAAEEGEADESGNQTHYGYFNTFLDAIDGSYCTYSAYGEKGDSKIDPKYPNYHKGGYRGKLQCGAYKAPNVLSLSYGSDELFLPFNYQRRQCREWMKLALQGTTVISATGDCGVGSCISKTCDRQFSPGHPNGCPWITTVGASQIPSHGKIDDHEIASDPYGGVSSSGGFSLIFHAPKYQAAAIKGYFAGKSAPSLPYFENGHYKNSKGFYNRNGRAFPDIAAVGVNILISRQDHFTLADGASASAPIIAAMFNRIVEARLAIGKGPLGFINAAIYQNPHLFNDITGGTNPYIDRRLEELIGCDLPGFQGAKGWDPVTGLGTPKFPELMNYFVGLPDGYGNRSLIANQS